MLVTAISPTPAGEGKSTVSVGLSQALRRLGRDAILCMREPSLGPVFGVKGGAAGGGYSQVLPMDDINLHFTGDFHAIASAHSLLSAMLDNHLLPRQRARPRRQARHLATHHRHERSRAASRDHWRGRRQRVGARRTLGDHSGQRSHGHHRACLRCRRPRDAAWATSSSAPRPAPASSRCARATLVPPAP